jgi:RHS repeat-associated protein
VSINGSGFTGATAVLFGGIAAASYTVNSSTSITAVAPAGTAGAVDITVTVPSSTNLLEQATYSLYGQQTIQAGSDVSPFGFQGSYTDPSGFIYLINRYYDPSSDQFLSIDPAVAQTGQPYAFTGDDPLNKTDPLGLKGGPGIVGFTVNWICSQHPHSSQCKGAKHKVWVMTHPKSSTFDKVFAYGILGLEGAAASGLAAAAAPEAAGAATVPAWVTEAAPIVGRAVTIGATARIAENKLEGIASNPNYPDPTRDLAGVEVKVTRIGDYISGGNDLKDLWEMWSK